MSIFYFPFSLHAITKQEVRATPLAMVASRYYLDYRTMKLFQGCFGGDGGDEATLEDLCRLLADAQVGFLQ